MYRIGEGKKWLMMIVAVIIDVIEIFASATIVVAIISGVVQYALMWGMFAASGVKFFGTAKRMRRQVATGILESIPFVEMLPLYTWSVWKTIEESRREDEANREGVNNSGPNTIRTKNKALSSAPKTDNIIRPKRT